MTDAIDRIGELLAKLQCSDFYAREEAVRELARYEKDEAVAGLVLALEDSDLGIRELAADQLSRIKGSVAAHLLIRFLGHGDIGTRNLAAEILVRIGAPAVEPLLENLGSDDQDVRKFIVDVLGLIGDERAVEPICRRLDDDNLNVVCSAAEALGEIGSAKAVPNLLKAYERVEEARLPAVEAIGKIGEPSTLSNLYEFMGSEDPIITFAAIEAVGNIGVRESVPKLIPFLEHRESTLAEAALAAIINISSRDRGAIDEDLPLDRFVDFLFEKICCGDRKITDFTFQRLPRWHGDGVIRSLLDTIDLLADDDRARALEILRRAGSSISAILLEKFPKETIPWIWAKPRWS